MPSNDKREKIIEKYKEITEIGWTCPLCSETLVEPTNLSGCGHVFCKECIEQMVFNTSSISMIIKCPTCRATAHPCQVRASEPNVKLANIINIINPEGYEERKKEYFSLKEKYMAIRKFLHTSYVGQVLNLFGDFMNDIPKKGVTVSQMAGVIRENFPSSRMPVMETKLLLATCLRGLVVIHKKRILRKNAEDMESYIQENAENMTGLELANFVRPFTALNYELNNTGITGLERELMLYLDNNLDRIVKYLKKHNDFIEDDEDSSEGNNIIHVQRELF